MIFTIGLVLALSSFIVVKATEPAFLEPDPVVLKVAVYGVMLGLVLMIASVCILAWRYLP